MERFLNFTSHVSILGFSDFATLLASVCRKKFKTIALHHIGNKGKCRNIGTHTRERNHVWNAEKNVNVSKYVDFIFHIFAAQEFRPSRDPNYAIHQGLDFFIGVDKKICATNWPKVPVLGLRTLIAHLHRWWTNIPSKGKVNFVGGFFLGPSNSWVHRVKHTQVVKRL